MIVITGGGTGGHLAIADAAKEALNKEGIKPIFIGSTRGQDQRWFKNDRGFSKTYFLKSQGVMNKNILGKFSSLFNIILLSFKVLKIYRENNIKAVLSVGGYSAAPAGFAAVLGGKQLYIHEQNSVVGSLNKLLRPFSKKFFSSFGDCDYIDYPVKEVFFQKSRVRERLKRVIFLGGSQGARSINNLALDLIDYFQKNSIEVVHQCGENDYERVKKIYEEKNFRVDLFPFTKNLVDKIECCDFAIARSGAGTLFELSANQIPALFIPYPYAALNHQYFNGKYLSDKNLGYVMQEREIDIEKIKEILEKDLNTISKNLKDILKKDGNISLVKTILKEL